MAIGGSGSEGVLREVADPQIRCPEHLPRLGLGSPGEDAQQGRLAGTRSVRSGTPGTRPSR